MECGRSRVSCQKESILAKLTKWLLLAIFFVSFILIMYLFVTSLSEHPQETDADFSNHPIDDALVTNKTQCFDWIVFLKHGEDPVFCRDNESWKKYSPTLKSWESEQRATLKGYTTVIGQRDSSITCLKVTPWRYEPSSQVPKEQGQQCITLFKSRALITGSSNCTHQDLSGFLSKISGHKL